MAVAGGAKPSVTFKVENQILVEKSRGMRVGVVTNFEQAVRQLLEGETVAVQNYGSLIARVREEVEARLPKS